MRADLQLSHYTMGREGQGVAKETSSTAFKYCNSKTHYFVSPEEEPDTCKGRGLLMNTFESAQCSCSKAAKPTAEQKNDESPEKLPQAIVPLWISPGAAKGKDLITWLMAQASD